MEGIVFLAISDIVRKDGIFRYSNSFKDTTLCSAKNEANAEVGGWQTVKIYSCFTATSSNFFFLACVFLPSASNFMWTFFGYHSHGGLSELQGFQFEFQFLDEKLENRLAAGGGSQMVRLSYEGAIEQGTSWNDYLVPKIWLNVLNFQLLSVLIPLWSPNKDYSPANNYPPGVFLGHIPL